MSKTNLLTLTYSDPKAKVLLTNYADTVVFEEEPGTPDEGEEQKRHKHRTLCAIRFGGYPESVKAMSDAIYGGGSVSVRTPDGQFFMADALVKQYRRQLTHDRTYAEATLIADDDALTSQANTEEDRDGDEDPEVPEDLPPRSAYIFCGHGDRKALFEEVDRKTAVPMILAFQNYILDELESRGILRRLSVCASEEAFEAWVLHCTSKDENIAQVVEDGIMSGAIRIPNGKSPGDSPFDGVDSVTSYLNTFGVVLAERIKKLFVPLFDPAEEPLSEEVLDINDYIRTHAGYPLYDAQLAVAEAVKRQLQRSKVGLIIAECGSGKSKIGATALASLWGLHSSVQEKQKQNFNIVLCPSHMTEKWVREIEESLPDTFACVVTNITQFDQLYDFYRQSDKSCYCVISKEQARDGYMRCPAVRYRSSRKNRPGGFICPDCGEIIEMDLSEDGTHYKVPAGPLYFRRENDDNHKCEHCGSSLWTTLNPSVPSTRSEWVKIGEYGFVHRRFAADNLDKLDNAVVRQKILEVAETPTGSFSAVGARRAFPLSSYIKKRMRGRIDKKRMRGRIDGLLVDELHEFSQNSGQGDAMNELFRVCRKCIGMTATLINGYSSGIFYLLFRLVPSLMRRDGKEYQRPGKFNDEYGVVQSVYETNVGDYNYNRRSVKTKKVTRQLPGVSPLVYSRFLLESACFLTLADMGADLPEYEEIPLPLEMPEVVAKEYKDLERTLKRYMKENRKSAKKILSAYLNLLMAYPDQPYGQRPIIDPINGVTVVQPRDASSFDALRPREEKVLEIVERKVAAGEKVLIYTNWTRLDTQVKLNALLTEQGYRTVILEPKIQPAKRERWVSDQVARGAQVMITNPEIVKTGLDLNDFTTLIFYDTGYKLFTLRQASRRSWRINQRASRVEVFMLYYADTMQHKAIKLMASKLAVAGIIEGQFSDEGLAAMEECEDITTAMAKELALGIRDSVEDLADQFKKMAFLKPEGYHASAPREEEVQVERSAPVLEFPGRAAVRKDGHALQKRSQDFYVELRKRPKKKIIVLEGQLSMFDVPA